MFRLITILAALFIASSASAQVIYAPPTPTVSYDRSHDNLYPPNSPLSVLRADRLPHAVNFYVPYAPRPRPAIVSETSDYTPVATAVISEPTPAPLVLVHRSDNG